MGRAQRLGLTVGATFGLVFVLVNAGELPSPWPGVLRVTGVLSYVGLHLALQAAARRPAPQGTSGVRVSRGYGIVVLVEVVALFGGLLVLARVLDLPDAGVAWVALVVGLHFVALAVVWREPSLHVLGAALTVCGAAGLGLAATGAGQAAVSTVGGVVPGFVLIAGSWIATAPERTPQDA